MRTQKLDMLNGPIWNKIPRFALPVAATAILEQLFNASDIAVVGNFTGAEKTAAVAAVGANSPIIGLIVNLFIGIVLGANVVIAHAIGQGDQDSVHKAVHTSVLLSLLGGVVVAVLGELVAAPLLGLLNVPEDVFPLALLYLRIYLLGMPVILLYNFEAAIFRSIGETKTPLLALTASGVLNVLLNLSRECLPNRWSAAPNYAERAKTTSCSPHFSSGGQSCWTVFTKAKNKSTVWTIFAGCFRKHRAYKNRCFRCRCEVLCFRCRCEVLRLDFCKNA